MAKDVAGYMRSKFKFSDSIKLIKNIKTTGTVTPSSKFLIRNLIAPIDFAAARYIVELGPGNGCVTRSLLRHMHPDCVLICLELDNEFVVKLSALGDSRLRVYNACATSIPQILEELQVDCVDYIVSSLPLALIDDEVVHDILVQAKANLRLGGRFLQYQYSLANYADMKPVFSSVKLDFTIRNLPPAFVYECVK